MNGAKTVASSALTQARARLGAEPMEWLFLSSAEEWAHRSAGADRWRGLALYGVDGTTMRVADSVENREHFGSQDSGRHDGDELVEFKVSSGARKKDPTLLMHFDARVVRYQRKSYQPQLLITSLVDEKRYPAAEIEALYHERWEIEIRCVISSCRPADPTGLFRAQ